jgi:hypothetical protein
MVLRVLALAALACVGWAESRTKSIILITADGLRWQELFGGLDDSLVGKATHLRDRFGKGTPEERRAVLMPFFWTKLAQRSVVLGNVQKGSSVQVSNAFRVSYPGYSEILTGRAQDDVIKGNNKIQNPTETILEFLKRKWNLPKNKVALFGSWDVFGFIGESKPGSVYINSGYQDEPSMPALSRIQNEAMTPWDSVRHDYVTFEMALEYMRREKPRVMYIALGETDDWAHDKRYDRVISSIQYFDDALRRIFEFVDKTPEYRGSTTIVITTDHGRGSTPEDWNSHGSKVAGAEQIWLAISGPDTAAKGEVSNSKPMFQRDIVPMILDTVGIERSEYIRP